MPEAVGPVRPAMTDVLPSSLPPSLGGADGPSSQPRAIPQKKLQSPLLDLTSPINENGSFDFDRVIKSGNVSKRSRHTKQWKPFHIVLRPNLLSIYKSASEKKLHKQITLADLTAVAALKDPKGRRNHMFGLFSPARNYHFAANNAAEARSWVETISREARIDEEEELVVGSPPGDGAPLAGPSREAASQGRGPRQSTSSPEPIEHSAPYTTKAGVAVPGIRKTSFQENDYSGNEHASYSDFSDTAPSRVYAPPASLQLATSAPRSSVTGSEAGASKGRNPSQANANRNTSQAGNARPQEDEEQVIWQGHLLALKSKGGVRQWKKLWVVIRRKHIALYKTDEVMPLSHDIQVLTNWSQEYTAHLIIPMSNILNAVEIDPISRSKAHCLQIIAEEKSFRFCARDEDALLRCLGALKSQLARRKERETARRAGPQGS